MLHHFSARGSAAWHVPPWQVPALAWRVLALAWRVLALAWRVLALAWQALWRVLCSKRHGTRQRFVGMACAGACMACAGACMAGALHMAGAMAGACGAAPGARDA